MTLPPVSYGQLDQLGMKISDKMSSRRCGKNQGLLFDNVYSISSPQLWGPSCQGRLVLETVYSLWGWTGLTPSPYGQVRGEDRQGGARLLVSLMYM